MFCGWQALSPRGNSLASCWSPPGRWRFQGSGTEEGRSSVVVWERLEWAVGEASRGQPAWLFGGGAILRRLATFSSLVGGWLKVRRQVLGPRTDPFQSGHILSRQTLRGRRELSKPWSTGEPSAGHQAPPDPHP